MHHPIVEFRGVSFRYGEDFALSGLDLTVREGAFLGIVGPSGAGKTTLIRLLSGAAKPTAGEIRFGGEGGRIRLGVVPQLNTIDWNFPITVEEVVLLGRADDRSFTPWASREVRAEAHTLLDRLGIGELARRHIRNLSGGQQQRAFIARALLRRPDLLLLDEPTSGVDVKTRHDILHLLHTLNHDGITIVLTTHDLNAVATHLPRLVCLNRRVIATGAPAEVLNPVVLKELYGADMVVVEQDGLLLIGDVPGSMHDAHDRASHPERTPAAHFGEEPDPHDHGAAADHVHGEATAASRPGRGRA
jgi:ABC-type Mn2+/Zn2+ transport system ATPase subunit